MTMPASQPAIKPTMIHDKTLILSLLFLTVKVTCKNLNTQRGNPLSLAQGARHSYPNLDKSQKSNISGVSITFLKKVDQLFLIAINHVQIFIAEIIPPL